MFGGQAIKGEASANCNVILAAIFFCGGRNKKQVGGGNKKEYLDGLKRLGQCTDYTVANNDFELRFSGAESGTSLITRGQMSSLLAVSLVAGGTASFPSLARGPSLCFPLSPLLFFRKFLHVF